MKKDNRGTLGLQRQAKKGFFLYERLMTALVRNEGRKTMKTKTNAIITIVVILGFAEIVHATIVDITVATDKESYLLGEEVIVSVTAYNPNPEPVTLGFSSSLVVSYLMDNAYDWAEGRIFQPVPLQITIQPCNFKTLELVHGYDEMAIYPLDVGTHTVVGEVVGYGQSAPVEFEVIPEPTTFLLLGFGYLLLRRK